MHSLVVDNIALFPIPDFPGYYVSRGGKVFSTNYKNDRNRTCRFLKPLLKKSNKYVHYVLVKNSVRFYFMAHKLVLLALRGPRPGKNYQASHLDGNPTNNNISNLCWETARENNSRKKQHGTWQIGDNASHNKLTAKQVLAIRKEFNKKVSYKILAKKYNVSFAAIHHIMNGRTWSHLNG